MRVEHAAVARRRCPASSPSAPRARVVVVAGRGGEHGVQQQFLVRAERRRVGHIGGAQHRARAGRRVGAAVAGGEPARRSPGWRCRRRCRRSRRWWRAGQVAGAAEAVRADRRREQQTRRPGRGGPPAGAWRPRRPASARPPPGGRRRRTARVVQQGGHVVGEVPQATGGVHRRGLGAAVPAQVRRDDPQASAAGAAPAAPERRGRAVAVHEQHRGAVRWAADEDVLADAVASTRCSLHFLIVTQRRRGTTESGPGNGPIHWRRTLVSESDYA